MKKILATCLLAATAVVFGIGLFSLGASFISTPAEAGGACRCPLIYAPVQCDHDRTYSNQCLADCHNAKNCVPTGGI